MTARVDVRIFLGLKSPPPELDLFPNKKLNCSLNFFKASSISGGPSFPPQGSLDPLFPLLFQDINHILKIRLIERYSMR